MTAANVKNGRVDLSSVSYVSKETYDKWTTRGFPESGDVLITTEAPVGEVASFPGDKTYLITRRVIALRGKKGVLDNDFLLYSLLSPRCQNKLLEKVRGSTVPRVLKPDITDLEIFLPSYEVQRKISQVFSSIDEKIQLNRQINQTLEQIAQTIFKSWFVDFEPVKDKIEAKAAGRDPERAAMCAISGKLEPELDQLPPEQRQQLAVTAALFPNELVESELGLIPAGWEVRLLGDVTSYLRRGVSPKYTEDGGVMVLNQRCIRDNVVDVSKARRHDVSLRKIDGRELFIGDVLVNSTGVGTLGRVGQILDLLETTIVDSHVTVVRAKSPITWNYLGIECQRRQIEIEQLGEGSTGQTELNRGKFAGLPLTVPSHAALQAFDALTVPFRQQIAANLRHAKSLATLRDTLLPKLLSGELSVENLQQEATA